MTPEDLNPNTEAASTPVAQPSGNAEAAQTWLAVISGTTQEQGLTDNRAAAASWFGQFDRRNHKDAT